MSISCFTAACCGPGSVASLVWPSGDNQYAALCSFLAFCSSRFSCSLAAASEAFSVNWWFFLVDLRDQRVVLRRRRVVHHLVVILHAGELDLGHLLVDVHL